ncbi:beta-lactamase family protein [Salicibibacter cibarius]|uniref:Beta-lactamase family protein n=1 Tax=Salicibibacter cibarius TaxID=2743000 RepID=A0A7T6Z1Z5_9BACI|nr:serine hydrolase domain-containing protein [Salicibibacter cibarius]QQK75481.1 beta-lactamase family protein [Salicibibacter cibarius]
MDQKMYETFAESLLNTHQTPGAIISLNNQRYEQTFGYRDQENLLPVTPDTMFGIGSIAKAMTCIAVLQLQEAGELSIHDTIKTYIPEVTFQGSNDITLHHLMTHSSGIPPLNTLFYANKQSMERDGSFDLQIKLGAPLDREQDSIDTYDDLINHLNTIPFNLLDRPGRSFSYSNDGYALLGTIIERLSGQPYERYIETNIFQPLDMKNSFFNPDRLDHRAARLYIVDPTADTPVVEHSPEWWDAPAMWAAGYVKSTANDMLRFGDVFLNDGNGILTPESLDALTSQHIEVEPGLHYGYGVIVMPDFFGTTLIEHGGSIKGVTAHFGVLPDRDMAAICLTNIAGAPAESLLKGAVQSEMGIEPDKAAIKYEDYELTEAERHAIIGTYQSNEGQTIKVYEKNAAIFVGYLGTEIPTRSVGSRAVTIAMHGTEYLLQFTENRLHFGFRQLMKSENE